MTPQVADPRPLEKGTTPTATPNQHLQAMDEAFAIFRNSLDTQITSAQAADNCNKAKLTTQVHDLTLKVADAETARDKLENQLVEAKAEAEKWKTQYEGLKKAMRDTMERRF